MNAPDNPDRSFPGRSDLSSELGGISELFGLRDGATDTRTRTGTDTVGRWVAGMHEGVAQPADVSGRLVHGRYRLIAQLGAGGMGVTYRAWDTQDGVPVVIKMPKREMRSDAEAMTRFAREIDSMRAVPHESIVPITDSGSDDGVPFVSMRFLPGGSLADYRRRDESGAAIRNPPGMLHFWLSGVAGALDHIHSKGMLHRDVKPGNVFLDGFLKPYLGDFGIAKVVDESAGLAKEQTLTATKMAVGTPEYMAPELFKPKSRVDGRVDQYALAVTVYEMLCGEKPFTGSRAHIIVEHTGLAVPPLEARVPGLPRSVYAAVERGLAKKPEERFTTCGEFAAAVLADLPVLEPEADTVRLLCPACKNILKLPMRAAGRTGKCPRCQTAMDVAADVGSLWLESEERGGPTAGVATTQLLQGEPDEPKRAPKTGTSRGIYWVAIGAAVVSLIVGTVWGSAADRKRLDRLHAEGVRSLQANLEAAKTSLRDAEARIKELEQRVQDRDKTIAGLEKVKDERDSLEADNRRLLEAQANAKNGLRDPAHAPSKPESSSGTSPSVGPAGRSAGLDGVDIEFVAIPAGTFTMGSPPGEPGHQAREKQVEVTITEGFEIGRHEVTQRQWTTVMKTEPWKGYGQSTEGADHPATCVGWEGAMQFCKVLTEKGRAAGTLATDKVYRLPTEAEWEYACRAGTRTAYFFGEDPKSLDEYAWCDGKPPRPVGGKKPNPWGLFDVYGNVSEWCLDWNDMNPLSGGEDPLGAASGYQRMQRGKHSRYNLVWMFRSAYRKDHGTSGDHTEGFRIVRGSARPITPPAPATQQPIKLPAAKPLEPQEVFTLSDEALLKLDFQAEPGQTAKIVSRRDVPGLGVEFDIMFKGNGGRDYSGQWVYRPQQASQIEKVSLSTDLSGFRGFGLEFELIGVDGKRPAAFAAPLIVGASIVGYRPEVIHTDKESKATSITGYHSDEKKLRQLGFVINQPGWWYEKDPSKNPWPKDGCTVTLRVAAAPGAVPLPFRQD